MLEYNVDIFEDFKKQAQMIFPYLDFSHFKPSDDTTLVANGDKGEGDGEEVNNKPR